MPDRRFKQAERLHKLGYVISTVHEDGVVTMTKLVQEELIIVHVGTKGEIRPPQSQATMIASAELHEAGISTTHGTRVDPVSL